MKKIFLFVALLSLMSCKDEIRDKDINVVFTCDTQGRLEPCGCFTGQYGGLARIANKSSEFSNANTLRFDVGDALPGHEDFNLIYYSYVQQAFKMMNFDAMNIGEQEAKLNIDQLRSIDQNAGPPLISANLLDAASGKAIFPTSLIIKRQNLRIAVIGILDPQLVGENLGEGLRVDNMESAITQSLETCPSADMYVLLAFCNEEKMKKLARKFFEFDLILGGKVRQPSQKLLRENRSILLATTNQAKNIAYLQGNFRKDAGFKKCNFRHPPALRYFPRKSPSSSIGPKLPRSGSRKSTKLRFTPTQRGQFNSRSIVSSRLCGYSNL